MSESVLFNSLEDRDGLLKYYKLIGKIKDAVTKADTMDEAIENGIIIISDVCNMDYAIAWYYDKEQDCLYPNCWVGAKDFTSGKCPNGTGIVGEVFLNDMRKTITDYRKGEETVLDQLFEEDISSVVCIPFSSKTSKLGCMLFVKSQDAFTDEEADVCEIYSLFLAMTIDEEDRFYKQVERSEVILSARNIERQFKNGDIVTKVLKGVNLDVYKGEFLVVLGESGCGKSTFLNIIGGMDKADSGSFYFDGKDYSHASQNDLTEYRRENIGFIFQSYNLMPNLNARQNLELIAELVADPMDVLEALELVGLKEKQNNYPSQLSGGQQQRISIARALVKKPRLIFADEPTAALDYTTSIEVLAVMEEIVKQGTTLVMVTHNEEITRMADRVVRIRNGRTYEVTINRNPVHASELVW